MNSIDALSLKGEEIAMKLEFDKVERIEFKDKIFVLTGDFLIGSKKFIQEWIEYHGGTCKSSLVKKTNYLVVGKLGSAKWKYGSSGGMKLEKLRELKFESKEIFTITEDQLIESLLSKVEITDPSKFKYEDIGEGIRISDFVGDDKCIRVPSEIEGKPVLEIGEYAFGSEGRYSGIDIKLVILPDSIYKINKWAFKNCRELNIIILPNKLREIGESAFEFCISIAYFRIPDTLERLGEDVFSHTWIKNLDLNYKLGKSETSTIRISLFWKEDMDGILLGLEEIENSQGSTYDEKILYLPAKGINMYMLVQAFDKNSNELGLNFKLYDKNLTAIRNGSFKPLMAYSRLSQPIILDEKTRIHLTNYLAKNCIELFTKLKLLSGIKLIASNGGFNAINIDNWIQATIDGNFVQGTAFLMDYKNINISSDDIQKKIEKELNANPNSRKKDKGRIESKIKNDPLSRKEMLKLWGFQTNLEGGYTILSYKGNDAEIDIPSRIGKKSVNKIHWRQENFVLKSVTIPDTVNEILDSSFYSFISLEHVNIPPSVKKIGDWVFHGCKNLVEVSLPNGLERIGMYSFDECVNLEMFKFIYAEGKDTFDGNYSIADGIIYNKDFTQIVKVGPGRKGEVRIPEGVTSMAGGAFSSCIKLESVTIPEGIKSIPVHAFDDCINIKTIIIPNGVMDIGYRAFSGCKGLETIDIPAGVKSIDKSAFSFCFRLETVNLPEGLETIGDGAFYSCEALKTIDIPAGVKSIDKSAFSYCERLVTVNLNEGIETIGEEAFYNCRRLASIYIPESVISIGQKSFSDKVIIKALKNSYPIKYAQINGYKYEEI